MPFWYIATLATLVTWAILSADTRAIAAAATLAAVSVLSVSVLVPINNRVAHWSSDKDIDRILTDRWDRYHQLRVALLAVVLILLAISVS